jgi:ATP-dependent RNA helicase DDX24/MAK5
MQISNVIKDIIKTMTKNYSFLTIKIATVVGGMSEDKQRRLLSTRKTPLHMIIATPGRLAEIFADEYIDAFQDLSQIRYLVIDEADRMMEEGHFPELYRIFARFSDHDEIVKKGDKVQDIVRRRREGVPAKEEEGNEDDDEETKIRNLDDQFIDPDALVDDDINEMMKQQYEMNTEDNEEDVDENIDNDKDGEMEDEEAEEQVDTDHEQYGLEDASGNRVIDNGGRKSANHYSEEEENEEPLISFSLQRQTLLYTATGLETTKNKTVLSKSYLTPKQSKKLKLKGTVKGLSTDTSLPTAIKE